MKVEWIFEGDIYEDKKIIQRNTGEESCGIVPVVRVEALRVLVGKWRAQQNAKESLVFRFAMRNLEQLLKSLEGA